MTANVFDVHINDRKSLTRVDLARRDGLLQAQEMRIPDVVVIDGKLDIEFWSRAGRYEVSGIAIQGEVPATAPEPEENLPVVKNAGKTVIAINCGGPDYTDPDGTQWHADKKFDGK